MFIETTTAEAELLIAMLTFAEGAAATLSPPLVAALEDLTSWRTALLRSYLRERGVEPKSAGAVDPVDGLVEGGPRA